MPKASAPSAINERQLKALLKHWAWAKHRFPHGYPTKNALADLQIYQDAGVVSSLKGAFGTRLLVKHIPEIFLMLDTALDEIARINPTPIAYLRDYWLTPMTQSELAKESQVAVATIKKELSIANNLLLFYINATPKGETMRRKLREKS